MSAVSRKILSALTLFGLAGCSGFLVDYAPISPEASRAWTVKAIHVDVPEDLEVNTINIMIPNEDIVWYGDGPGDKRAQVAEILEEGLSQGSKTLKGPVPVVFDVELVQFHALTPRAFHSAPSGTGVESVRYKIEVRDARTDAVIVPEQMIASDGRALVAVDGGEDGIVERNRIVAKIAETTRGWLGIGRDNRTEFERLGR
ncbi:DUF6778 family protein [Celeribacter sp.]|uniref:DUF6778 family protein n=1 Tax=Celeribacter sp. TaxID=1890673 RepID=UPI003A93CE9C